MGNDRPRDHLEAGTRYITGADYSCLMHLDGIVRKEGYPIEVVHVAEILNGSVQ